MLLWMFVNSVRENSGILQSYQPERCIQKKEVLRGQVEVGEIPSSKAPSWRGWLMKFLNTAVQLNWNYHRCCEKLSESLEGAVFNALLETKLSVEVEFGYPSVTDILSRTLTLIGVTQMENLENPFFHQIRLSRGLKKIFLIMLDECAQSKHSLWKKRVMSNGYK